MKDILKFRIKSYQVVDEILDIIVHNKEIKEQISADMILNGIKGGEKNDR